MAPVLYDQDVSMNPTLCADDWLEEVDTRFISLWISLVSMKPTLDVFVLVVALMGSMTTGVPTPLGVCCS